MSDFEYIFTASSVKKLTIEAIGMALLRNTARLIAEMNLFYTVGPQIRADHAPKTPACILTVNDVNVTDTLNGEINYVDYSVKIGIAESHPNDAVLLSKILAYSQAIRHKLSRKEDGTRGILLFSDVAGHFSTKLDNMPIDPMEEFDNDVVVFNSGINMVYSVKEYVL